MVNSLYARHRRPSVVSRRTVTRPRPSPADPSGVEPFGPWPFFAEDEIQAAATVLRSGKVNQWTGEEVRSFEREFAARSHCEFGVAVANGTLALELALWATDVSPGDDVLVTSRTFIASASAVVMGGARPIMADVDPESQNVTVDTLRAAMTPATRAIIAVHLAGWPCDMGPIMAFAEEEGLTVIEDCAQALGASYEGRPVGSLGHVAAFSFCQDKILTTGGEGGMVTTNDRAIWERAWSRKDHGKSFDAVFQRTHPPGFRWLHEDFGSNYRMTEMQAAIGRRQLQKLDGWVETRRRFAAMLDAELSPISALRVTRPPESVHHAYYKYYAFVRPDQLREGWDRDRIMVAVSDSGVPCYSGSCSEIYQEAAFASAGYAPRERLPTARALGETSLMLLVHPTLTEGNIRHTAREVRRAFAQAEAR